MKKRQSKRRFKVPEDLALEILLKLPIKSLVRFNCVCKSWCSSFLTLHFISKHIIITTLKASILISSSNAVMVYGPCNGLMCLYDHGDGKAALWNPSTRKFKILPRSSAQCPPFPGYTSFKCVGFGYDSKTDDYKVIQFVTLVYIECVYPPEFWSQVELYSLRSDSWKEISSVPNACPFSNYLALLFTQG
ncbi:hypothetical protein V6N13_084581 [Hibiscus sabdariffa]